MPNGQGGIQIFFEPCIVHINKNELTGTKKQLNEKSRSVLSVRFEVGVSLLLAPAGTDKRGLFPLVGYAGIQPAIRKRVPGGAPAGARSY